MTKQEKIALAARTAREAQLRDDICARSVLCPDIHQKLLGRSYRLDDPADEEAFMALEGHVEKCALAVETAARLAAEMILEDDSEEGEQAWRSL